MMDSTITEVDGLTTIRLAWPESPIGFRVNQLRNMHFRDFGKRNAYWRDETFVKLGDGAPALQWANIVVDEVVASNPNHLPDVGACFPAYKAALDGLVDVCKILPKDSPEFVRSVTFTTPAYVKGEAWLVISLTGPARHVHDDDGCDDCMACLEPERYDDHTCIG